MGHKHWLTTFTFTTYYHKNWSDFIFLTDSAPMTEPKSSLPLETRQQLHHSRTFFFVTPMICCLLCYFNLSLMMNMNIKCSYSAQPSKLTKICNLRNLIKPSLKKTVRPERKAPSAPFSLVWLPLYSSVWWSKALGQAVFPNNFAPDKSTTAGQPQIERYAAIPRTSFTVCACLFHYEFPTCSHSCSPGRPLVC